MGTFYIYNLQRFRITERSEIVRVTDEDIVEFRKWESFPYTGDSTQDLLPYITQAFERFSNGELEPALAPNTLVEMYLKLDQDVIRTTTSTSLDMSGESTIMLEGSNRIVIDEIPWTM